jgi:hypothetical protein
MTKTSFGKYFDDQRDRIVKAMQNKNAQQNIEWMENHKKKKEIWSDERLDALHQVNMADTYIDEDAQLFWWESIGT